MSKTPSGAPLFYVTSAGQKLDPGEVHLARFANGIRLAEREGRSNANYPNLARLKEVYDRRKAAFDAAGPK